jgi:hypothetical protein
MHAEAAQSLADNLPDAGTVHEAVREFGKKAIDAAEQAEKESAKKLATASEKVADELNYAEASIANKKVIILLKLANGLLAYGSFSYNTRFVFWSISIEAFENLSTFCGSPYILLVHTITPIKKIIKVFCSLFLKLFTFLNI